MNTETEPITGLENTIDSRDIIARIEYLDGLDERDGAETEELAYLRAFADEMEGYCADWRHGEQMIADSYFERHAAELADDLGYTDPNAKWPMSHIDWESAAEELKGDYTCVELNGHTFWGR